MTVPGGGCRSLGCRGYLRALLDTRISPGTTTRFHRHLPQAHRLAMSLTSLKFHSITLKERKFTSQGPKIMVGRMVQNSTNQIVFNINNQPAIQHFLKRLTMNFVQIQWLIQLLTLKIHPIQQQKEANIMQQQYIPPQFQQQG